MGDRVNYSGLVIAGIGFFLTRFTVTLAINQNPGRFYLSGVVPLVLGLGLAAFGVALTVADIEREFVRTTALWCVIGSGTMLLLSLLTVLGSTRGSMADPARAFSQSYLSTFLIGGSVGGTLTGLYAARTRQQRRELLNQANRLEVLNRFLRHEILNAVTAIRGYADLSTDEELVGQTVIKERSDRITETVEEVSFLTEAAMASGSYRIPVDPTDHLAASVASVTDEYPEADVAVETDVDELSVLANERLEDVFTHLLENAIVHSPDERPAVRVSVTATAERVRVSVRDRGPGLPAAQQALLEDGEITRYDDPRAGYGLNIVRLLVESYDGTIETEVGPGGTTVTVSLRRGDAVGTDIVHQRPGLVGVRPALPQLLVILGASLIAGVCYGFVAERLGGSVAGIGVLYGAESAVVGWITHEFHSVVFGFVYAGLVSVATARGRRGLLAYLAIGLGWGLVLWLVAAGVISAIWLRLLSIRVPIPSLSTVQLVTHVVWGASLALLTAFGYEYVAPRLARLRDRRATDARNGN